MTADPAAAAPAPAPAPQQLPEFERSGPEVKIGGGTAPVIPIAMILAGAYLAWFGIHYWRDKKVIWPTDPVKDILQGKGLPAPSPSQAEAQNLVASEQRSAGGGFSGTVNGKAIASDAKKYVGKVRYKWGGADPSTGWDCSGMVSWVLCHDLRLSIPGYAGGSFDGSVHGPNVASYLAWAGAEHVLGPVGTVEPGDLVCWGPNQHMGIAISPTRMISAEDPANGTRESPIAGFFATPPIILRVRELASGSGGGGSAPAPGGGGGAGGPSPAEAQNTARLLAADYGWAPSGADSNATQWADLVKLWQQESGWQWNARNSGTGAYGIPQANPGSKMADIAPNWRTSAKTQIEWGLFYIFDRYGSPSAAWAHEQANGWY